MSPGRRMRELQARWKPVALAPRAQGEVMWRRFKTAQDEVFARTVRALRGAERRARRATSPASRRCASAPRRSPTRPTGSRPPRRFRRCRPSGRASARSRADTRRPSGSGSAPRAIASSRAARKISSAARKSGPATSRARKRCARRPRRWPIRRSGTAPPRSSSSCRPSGRRSGQSASRRSEAIWQRFRTACDRFFDRFKHRDQLELQEKAAVRDTVIRELEALVPAEGAPESAAPENLYTTVQQARSSWQQAPELPRALQQDLAARYHQAVGRLVARLAGRVRRHRSRSRNDTQAHGEARRRGSRRSCRRSRRSRSISRRPSCWRSSCANVWPPTRCPAGIAPPTTRNRAGARPSRKCAARFLVVGGAIPPGLCEQPRRQAGWRLDGCATPPRPEEELLHALGGAPVRDRNQPLGKRTGQVSATERLRRPGDSGSGVSFAARAELPRVDQPPRLLNGRVYRSRRALYGGAGTSASIHGTTVSRTAASSCNSS